MHLRVHDVQSGGGGVQCRDVREQSADDTTLAACSEGSDDCTVSSAARVSPNTADSTPWETQDAGQDVIKTPDLSCAPGSCAADRKTSFLTQRNVLCAQCLLLT